MSLPTTYHGLIKPDEGEMYDVDILNNNLDAIDLGLVKIDTANSTIDVANFNFTSSTFTRIRVQNKGIVVAAITAVVDTADALPINTATGDAYAGVIPAGYRPKTTKNYFQAIVAGAGRGDEVQVALIPDGQWLVRSNTGSAYTTFVGSQINTFITYEWDGNV